MTNNTYREIADMIKGTDDIVIFPHINADGDAMGSSVALCAGLRQLGMNAHVFIDDGVPGNLAFLDTDDYVITDGSGIGHIGLSIMVDCAGSKRIGQRYDVFAKGEIKGCIDHHASGDNDIDYDFYRTEPDSGAACELIYLLLKESGVVIDLNIANAVYTALMTDTGNFRHSSTTARTHRIAAELHEIAGFDPKPLSNIVYNSKTPAFISLQAEVLGSLRYYDDAGIVIGFVTQEMLERTGADMNEAGAFIDILMSIESVVIGVLLKERPDGSIRVSLRSKSAVDVSEVATAFDGGGHRQAAGGTVKAPVYEVPEIILPHLREAIRKAK